MPFPLHILKPRPSLSDCLRGLVHGIWTTSLSITLGITLYTCLILFLILIGSI